MTGPEIGERQAPTSSISYSPPPFDHPLPFPDYLARVARENPNREAIVIIQGGDDSLKSLTWRKILDDAIHQATEIVQSTGLHPRTIGEPPVTVGLLARNNYHYLVTATALFLLRWTVLFISPRNSKEAVWHLMSAVSSVSLFTDDVAALTGYPDAPFACYPVPGTTTSFGKSTVGCHRLTLPISNDGDYNRLQQEMSYPCMYIHTSGSTGHPKPISWTHRFLIGKMAVLYRDRLSRQGVTVYTPLPICHGGGFNFCFCNSLGSGGVFAFISDSKPISSDTAIRHLRALRHRDFDALLPPSILEDIVKSPTFSEEILAVLRYPKSLLWGGASLRKDVGDLLAENGVNIISWGGITEVGTFARSVPTIKMSPVDWPYSQLVDSFHFHFIPLDETDRSLGYNLIISPGFLTPPVLNHENPTGFLTADVWIQHPDPDKSDLWRIAGRLDDVTVLSNGEKTNNKQLEILLRGSPLVQDAIIFGTGKFFNGAIISPSPTLSPHGYLDELMSYIESHVNNVVPQHSRLLRPLVLLSQAQKPFIYSDKGTVKRHATLELYSEEIDTAYLGFEQGMGNDKSILHALNLDDEVVIRAYLEEAVASVIGHPIGPKDDFFNSGMDSLLATKLRFIINSALRDANDSLTLSSQTIYNAPTIDELSRALAGTAQGLHTNGSAPRSIAAKPDDVEEEISRLVKQFSFDFRRVASDSAIPISSDSIYAITGTTGSLGASFLSVLLDYPEVSKIYLLNRHDDKLSMAERHARAFSERGLAYNKLEQALLSGRAMFVEIDFHRGKLGIPEQTYSDMANEVTHIVHIAWHLHFKLNLSSYVSHIAGTRGLLDLALSSNRAEPPHFTFISSIAVVGRWESTLPVPEEPITSHHFTRPCGYGYAKYVAEKIVESAVGQIPGFRASIVRSGQISGALRTGAWSRKEFMPSILKASSELGMAPKDFQPLRWLPVDVAAKLLYAFIQDAKTNPDTQMTYYNLENAQPTSWSRVTSALARGAKNKNMVLVATDEWISRIPKDGTTSTTELLDFIDDYLNTKRLPVLDSANVRKAAGELAGLELTDEILDLYVAYACDDS